MIKLSCCGPDYCSIYPLLYYFFQIRNGLGSSVFKQRLGTCESRNAGTRNGTRNGLERIITIDFARLQIQSACLLHPQTPTACLLHLQTSTAPPNTHCLPSAPPDTHCLPSAPPDTHCLLTAPPDTYPCRLHLQVSTACFLHLLIPTVCLQIPFSNAACIFIRSCFS